MDYDIQPGQRAFKKTLDFNQRAALADTLTGVRQWQLVRMFNTFCVQTGLETLNGLSVSDKYFLPVAERRWQDLPRFCWWLMKQKGEKRGYIPPALINEVAKLYEDHLRRNYRKGVPSSHLPLKEKCCDLWPHNLTPYGPECADIKCCERDHDSDGNCDLYPKGSLWSNLTSGNTVRKEDVIDLMVAKVDVRPALRFPPGTRVKVVEHLLIGQRSRDLMVGQIGTVMGMHEDYCDVRLDRGGFCSFHQEELEKIEY